MLLRPLFFIFVALPSIPCAAINLSVLHTDPLSLVLGTLILARLGTEILILLCALIGIGFALFQWLLVSRVKLSAETDSSPNNGGAKNGYNDSLKKRRVSMTTSSAISEGCKKALGNALFIVGEIGGNDYGYPLSQAKSLEELKTYAPQVVSAITSTITELINLGAVTLMIPGNVPLGCNPSLLTGFAVKDKDQHDKASFSLG